MSNILGQPFDPWVKSQIEVRQKSLGKFGDIAEKDLLAYNTKAPFLRLASSIDLTNIGSEKNEIENSVMKKLIAAGFSEDEINGDKLAKSCILQGGVTGVDNDGNWNGLRSGLNNNRGKFNGSYGWGGIDERGFVPMPGITNANITYYNNGALSKTTIDITCFSKKQFAIIDVLFMRPGYTLLLEFGHSVYLDNSSNLKSFDSFKTPPLSNFLSKAGDITVVQSAIEKTKESSNGNYDAILGKITKFNWQFNPDGSYSCQVQLTAVGDVIESLKTNVSLSGEITSNAASVLKQSEEQEKMVKKELDVKGKQSNILLASNQSRSAIDNFLFDVYQHCLDRFAANNFKIDKNYVVRTDLTIKNFRSVNNLDGKKDLFFKDSVLFLTNCSGNEGQLINPRVYIKMGVFLAWIQSNCFLYDSAFGNPNIEFDMDFKGIANGETDKNYILNIPGQISVDPLKLLIPIRNFSIKNSGGNNIGYIESPTNTTLIDMNLSSDEQYLFPYANLMVSIDFLGEVLSGMKPDEDGTIKLLDYLENINEGLIASMGGINKFRFKISQDGLKIKIIEDIPQRFTDTPTGFTKINAYGVKPGVEGSFVRDLNLTADLSNDFAAMISIGAQSNGNQVGGNATAFSNYNAGLKDRVMPERLSSPTVLALENGEPLTPKDQLNNLIVSCAPIFSFFYKFNTMEKENLDSYRENMTTAINLALGIYSNSNGIDPPQLSTPFFLPFNLKLTMDGISGPKLYQKFLINDDILPPSYEKDGVSLMLTGLNHNIGTDGWTTEMETLSAPNARELGPISCPPPLEQQRNSYETGNTAPPPEDTLFTEIAAQTLLRLRLTRFFGNNRITSGCLEVLDESGNVLYNLATSELPWVGNKNMVSCIPSGKYLVKSIYRKKKTAANGRKCFHVVGLEENGYAYNQISKNGFTRDEILIHDAPRAKNFLLGCIAPGFRFNEGNPNYPQEGTGTNYREPSVNQSVAAMKTLLDTLWVNGSYFNMEIINYQGVADGALSSNWQNVKSFAVSKKLLPNPKGSNGGAFGAPQKQSEIDAERARKEKQRRDEARAKKELEKIKNDPFYGSRGAK